MSKYLRNDKLRRARELRGWTQREVADHIYLADARTLRRWENGEAFPSLRFRAKLCEVFRESPEELGLILETQSEERDPLESSMTSDSSPRHTLPDSSILPQMTPLFSISHALHSLEMPYQFVDVPEPFPITDTALEKFDELKVSEGVSVLSHQEPADTRKTTFWNLPHRRNPSFTGRADVLNQILAIFQQQQETNLPCLVALCGLGGLGKTQVAVEYAHRNRERYCSVVWLNASSLETVMIDLVSVTRPLLPGNDCGPKSLAQLIDVVRVWLEPQQSWLLILDDVTDIGSVEALLPPLLHGHVLLTTRIQATGMLAHKLNLIPMNVREGTLFLLRRAKFLQKHQALEEADKDVLAVATRVVHAMGGHSLALDQVGAYIEETQCNLTDYLALYRTNQASLLKRRGLFHAGYPDSVITTLRFCIESIGLSNSLAPEFLYFCAFLHPYAIPEELFTTDAAHLCPPLQPLAMNPLLFDEILSILMSYSLIKRNTPVRVFSVHPLVQDSLQAMLSLEQQKQWATWVLQVIDRVFPGNTSEQQSLCQRYLPHAYACATLVKRYHLPSPAAARFLEIEVALLQMAKTDDHP